MALELGLVLVGLAMAAVIVKQRVTLRAQRLEIERVAITDPLTKLYNRRGFDTLLDREVERAKRSDKFPSLIFLDIDGFTEINLIIPRQLAARCPIGVVSEGHASGQNDRTQCVSNPLPFRDSCQIPKSHLRTSGPRASPSIDLYRNRRAV